MSSSSSKTSTLNAQAAVFVPNSPFLLASSPASVASSISFPLITTMENSRAIAIHAFSGRAIPTRETTPEETLDLMNISDYEDQLIDDSLSPIPGLSAISRARSKQDSQDFVNKRLREISTLADYNGDYKVIIPLMINANSDHTEEKSHPFEYKYVTPRSVEALPSTPSDLYEDNTEVRHQGLLPEVQGESSHVKISLARPRAESPKQVVIKVGPPRHAKKAVKRKLVESEDDDLEPTKIVRSDPLTKAQMERAVFGSGSSLSP